MRQNKSPRLSPEAVADRASPVHGGYFVRERVYLQVFIVHFDLAA